MKSHVILTCVAVMLYAAQNVLMEMKFSKYSTVSILLIGYLVMLPLAIARVVSMRLLGETLVFPAGAVLAVAALTGFLWFMADYCYVSAYTVGGDLFTISMIITLFPVAATLIKFFLTGSIPNVHQIASWIFAVVAIYLATKGAIAS